MARDDRRAPRADVSINEQTYDKSYGGVVLDGAALVPKTHNSREDLLPKGVPVLFENCLQLANIH